ncbi:branched-chain amino acid ABC transporter permease [bacterium]|nr:branched-chain amino acid ABC transporter permease [bacterium]
MDILLQALLNGLMIAMFYILIALGLTLVFSIMDIINFAHGEMYMLGGYIVYYFCSIYHLNYFVTLFAAMLIVGFFGVVIEKIIFKPFRGQLLNAFIVSLGLAWILQSFALLSFGTLDKSVESPFSGMVNFFGITLSLERMIITAIGLLLVILLYLFIRYSKIGQAMRAVAQDTDAAAIQGINIDYICSVVFLIGSALAAGAGVLIIPIFLINPFVGIIPNMKALIIIIVGGMGSIPGVLLAGLFLGFIESFGVLLLSGPSVEMLSFLFVVLILIFRPKGIFGV